MQPGTTAAPLSFARGAAWFDAGSGRALAVLVAALLVVNVALCFPGTMMNDSYLQYREAVSGHFSDWHPPVMAWLWSKLRAVHEGPAPLLLVHLVVYWGAIGFIADAARRLGHRTIAVLVALSGAFPPFVFMNANVIKDVGMAVALLGGVAIVFWHRVQGRWMHPATMVVVALLLLYGTLVRTNAVFAIGPLLLYAMAPSRGFGNVRIVLVSFGVAVAAIPASQAINQVLFHPEERHAVESLFLYDLVGIAAQEKAPRLVEPRATMTQDDLRRCYTPFWWDTFSSWGPCGALVHRPDPDRATAGGGLARQWIETIRDHPLAYLVHRLKHFNSELFFAVPLKHLRLAPEYRGDDPRFPPYATFTPADVKLDLLRKNPSTWPVTWFVWAGVLALFLAPSAPTQTILLARALLFSALGYTLAYAVVGVATDFRYHYWSMLATVIATLLVLPHIARGFRARSPVLAGGAALVALVVAIGLVTRLLDFQAWVF